MTARACVRLQDWQAAASTAASTSAGRSSAASSTSSASRSPGVLGVVAQVLAQLLQEVVQAGAHAHVALPAGGEAVEDPLLDLVEVLVGGVGADAVLVDQLGSVEVEAQTATWSASLKGLEPEYR